MKFRNDAISRDSVALSPVEYGVLVLASRRPRASGSERRHSGGLIL